MKKGFIILAVVFLILLYVLQKTQTAKRLDFRVGTPKQISLRGGQLSFILPLNIRNPSKGSINVKSAEFDVYFGAKFLGKAISGKGAAIGPENTTTLDVRVEIAYLDMLSIIPDIIKAVGSKTVKLKIDGLVFAEGFQVPYANEFEFTLPKF